MSRPRIRDCDIRAHIKNATLKKFYEDSDSLIVEELGIEYGSNRIDIAVVNGHLHGYEIKSQTDDLSRLSAQAQAYNRVFDFLTLVVFENHIRNIKDFEEISHWKIIVVDGTSTRDNIRLWVKQKEKLVSSRLKNPVSLAKLLWREEGLAALDALGSARGYRSKSRNAILEKLVDITSYSELSKIVRTTLKTRVNWRVAEQPM